MNTGFISYLGQTGLQIDSLIAYHFIFEFKTKRALEGFSYFKYTLDFRKNKKISLL